MPRLKHLLCFAFIGLFASACSSTTVKDSWVKPGHTDKIENVYLIGIAKDESIRMLFENTFSRQLSGQGIKATSSFNDLPKDQEGNREKIVQAMTANGCDSVLLTKLVRKRREIVSTSPGKQMIKVNPVPLYVDPWYNSWGDYYYSSYSVINIAPKINEDVILTIESVLFNLKTEEMIWAAQLETVDEINIKKMLQGYVEEVTRNLKGKGLI